MANARDARAWARAALRGIGDSLYTPFSGVDGEDIDWDAYRTLLRHCVSDLGHPMLWCTSGVAEFWSLTLPERKRLLEIAIEEGRAANPGLVVQACTAATSPKDCVELTLHAAFRPQNSRRLHELAPELVIWECDLTVYRAGWLRAGIVCPAQLGTVGYLHETPQHRILTPYWDLVYNDKLSEAIDYARESAMDQFDLDMGSVFVCYPGRADYFTHWGGAFKHAAALLGLPIGDYPHSRAPQAELPTAAKDQIEAAYRRLGLLENP